MPSNVKKLSDVLREIEEEKEVEVEEKIQQEEATKEEDKTSFLADFSNAWSRAINPTLAGLCEVHWEIPGFSGALGSIEAPGTTWSRACKVSIDYYRRGYLLKATLPVSTYHGEHTDSTHQLLSALRETQRAAASFYGRKELRACPQLSELLAAVPGVVESECLRVIRERIQRKERERDRLLASIEAEKERIAVFPSPVEALAHTGREKKEKLLPPRGPDGRFLPKGGKDD